MTKLSIKRIFSVFSMHLKAAFEFKIIINCLISLLFFMLSCNTYHQISFSRRIFPVDINKKNKSSNASDTIKNYKLKLEGEKSYPVELQKNFQLNYKRYLTKRFSFSLLADINNLGVEYALRGMYSEAEILFNEVIKEDRYESTALNNLGVIYELNNNSKAFDMYSKACLMKPGNEFYRMNFLYFCDNKSHSVYY